MASSSQRISTASSGDFTVSPTKADYRRAQSAERAGRNRAMLPDEPVRTAATARPREPPQNGGAEYRLSGHFDPSCSGDLGRCSKPSDTRISEEYHNSKLYNSRSNFTQMYV
jgi:hypothetical protein